MAEPFGGDGGDGGHQIVNPANGCQSLSEYTEMSPSVTNSRGYTAPGCLGRLAPSSRGVI